MINQTAKKMVILGDQAQLFEETGDCVYFSHILGISNRRCVKVYLQKTLQYVLLPGLLLSAPLSTLFTTRDHNILYIKLHTDKIINQII